MRNCVVVNLLVNIAAVQEKVTKGIYMRKRCRSSVWFCLQLEFSAKLRYLVADCIYLFRTKLYMMNNELVYHTWEKENENVI